MTGRHTGSPNNREMLDELIRLMAAARLDLSDYNFHLYVRDTLGSLVLQSMEHSASVLAKHARDTYPEVMKP